MARLFLEKHSIVLNNFNNSMKANFKLLFLSILIGMSFLSFSQQLEEIKLNPEKVKKFLPYVEFKHGGSTGFPAWKENNKILFTKEIWYYSESFYIKRNVSDQGVSMDESQIDISRFESLRKPTEEVVITNPGFKDAIVLIPGNKLIYKP